MFGDFVEFQHLDVREWFRFNKARNLSQAGPRTRTHDYVCTTQLAGGAVGESGLYRSWACKLSCRPNELCSGFFVILQIHLVQASHHLALAFTDARHVNGEAVMSDAELLA